MVEVGKSTRPHMGIVGNEDGTDFNGGLNMRPARGMLEGGVLVMQCLKVCAVRGDKMGAEGSPVGGEVVVLGGGGSAVVRVGICGGRHSWWWRCEGAGGRAVTERGRDWGNECWKLGG